MEKGFTGTGYGAGYDIRITGVASLRDPLRPRAGPIQRRHAGTAAGCHDGPFPPAVATVAGVGDGHERATSFGTIAGDYDRLRPGPPEEAVRWLVPAGCGVAVDMGAGTGLLTRALTGLAGHVVAVEPDPRMAAVLRERSPGAAVVQGRGEAVPLLGATADGLFVSSAWHWLDPDRAVPEIARVLRAGGRLGIISTGADRETGWLREFGRLQLAAARGGGAGGGRPQRPRHLREFSLPGTAPFSGIERATFRFTRTMTAGDFAAMLGTYSAVITAAPQDREAGLSRVRALLEQRFPGAQEIEVPMRSQCVRVTRTPAAGNRS